MIAKQTASSCQRAPGRLLLWAILGLLLAPGPAGEAGWAFPCPLPFALAAEAPSATGQPGVDTPKKDAPVELPPDVAQQLDDIFQRYTTMGASLAVIKNGQILYTYTYGLRNREGDPVTQDTAFQVGSISKMVTAIGLMQQVEANPALLDGDLGDVLGFPLRHPEYPDTPITLRQLMSHTSGLRDNSQYNQAILGKPQPLEALFGSARAKLLFTPGAQAGTQAEYSNFAGGLAGSVLEALTGTTVDDYMNTHVFQPLGLTAGYQAALLPEALPLADMYAMPNRYATKILRNDPSAITTPDPSRNYTITAGKLIISAPDLAKLLVALCDGGLYGDTRLLMESSAAEMRTPQNNRGSVLCQSGRGLLMNIITDDQVEGRTLYGHGGKAYGMLCAAYFDPVDRTGVVMLTNGCNNRKVYNGVGMLGRAVLTLCYDQLIGPSHQREDPFLIAPDP